MNAVLEEKFLIIEEEEEKKYEYIPHEEVAELSRIMIERHRKAYKALANA